MPLSIPQEHMTASSLSDDESTSGGRRSPIQRVLLLLRLLADHTDTGLRVPEICKHLKIHRVSAHRMLSSLSDIGYVEQAPDLSYHLGFEAWFLGNAAAKHFTPTPVSESMTRIADLTGESVFVMRRAGLDGCIIACQEGSLPIRFVNMRVGTKRMMGVGALSVAILSEIDASEAETIIKQNAIRYPEFGLSSY